MGFNIALAGNPNSGKTTLFNALTGATQYVGNWPGVTVEKKEGKYTCDKDVVITDLPGIYSLSPYSPEEVVAREFLLDGKPDVVINVVDATNLERNLYLTTQMLDLGVPVVLALNMMDLVEKNGSEIDIEKLSADLGCSIVQVSALKNKGIDVLMKVATEIAEAKEAPTPLLKLSGLVEDAITKIRDIIRGSVPDQTLRWYSIKLFEGEEKTLEQLNLPAEVLDRIDQIREAVEESEDDDAESIVTSDRYKEITRAIGSSVKQSTKGLSHTQKIDRVVTNRVLGLPIFIIIMFLVYFIAVSTIGTVATDWANDGLFGDGWEYGGIWVPGIPVVLGAWLTDIGAADWLISLINDGIIAGVGAVLGFVPQMVILFLLLSILEACGYMARVAFLMDRIFRRFGLSGKSFIPMLIASGCGVPAIMATKTIENERDRRMTIMTTTFIPCSAKLPIIALVFGSIAGGDTATTWWVAPVFYFLGVIAVILSGIMLRKTKMFAGDPTPFVMELPQYHLPSLKGVLLSTWERVKSFIVKAGTIIFVASIIVWFLLNFGFTDGVFGMLDPEQPDYIANSIMAYIGNAFAWLFVPLGFGNWESAVTSITGLVAKENVVSTLAIITNLGDAGEADASMWTAFAALLGGSIPAIMAFCAFNLLCAPCFAAIGTIRKQMASAKWFWFAIGYQTVFAWVVALMIYQFGGLIAGDLSFNIWTVVAGVLLAGILFQLFRPQPKFKEKSKNLPSKGTTQEGSAA